MSRRSITAVSLPPAEPAASATATLALSAGAQRDTFYDGLPNIDRVFALDHVCAWVAFCREVRFCSWCFLLVSGILWVATAMLQKDGLDRIGSFGLMVIIGVPAYVCLECTVLSAAPPRSSDQHVALTSAGIRHDQVNESSVGIATTMIPYHQIKSIQNEKKYGCFHVTIAKKTDPRSLVIVGMIEAEAFVNTVQDRMIMNGGQNNDNNDQGSTTLNEEQNTADGDCMEERVFALDYGRVRWSHFLKLCFVFSVFTCFVILFVLLMSLAGFQGGPFPGFSMLVFFFWVMRTFVSRVALTKTGIRYDRLDNPIGTALFFNQAALYKSGRSAHTTTLHIPYSAIQGIECKKRHYACCSCVLITCKTDGRRLMVEGIKEVEEFMHMVENGMRGIDNNMIYNSHSNSDACTVDEDCSEGP